MYPNNINHFFLGNSIKKEKETKGKRNNYSRGKETPEASANSNAFMAWGGRRKRTSWSSVPEPSLANTNHFSIKYKPIS